MEGVGWHHLDIKDGKRQSAAVAYLDPALARKNLALRTGAYAERLPISGGRCVGVEYRKDGQRRTARARREVIVCAGAIESPKLLLLSGVGPAAALAQLGLPVVVDLPGVGENYHDHVLTGVIGECARPVPAARLNTSECALFWRSSPGWRAPDLQIAFVHVPFDVIVGSQHPNAVSILPGVTRPLSRGTIRLASTDPRDPPRIDPNYLGVESDRDRLVQGVELARRIFATRAFSGWIKGEILPGPPVQGGEQLKAWVRQHADTYHHHAGSCRMGLDAMAVVDPELRVHGVSGLRVADASVMPAVPSGNCNTAIVMIGERVADFIKRPSVEPREESPPEVQGDGRREATCRKDRTMPIKGKKIAILIESDFYEPEIFYYQRRFEEEQADLHFLTRLWGQSSLTFKGHEWHVPFECRESFEGMSDEVLRSYSAIIVPSGMVADRLRYSADVRQLAPATDLLRRAFAEPGILKGIICHGMWLVSTVPELVRGRRAVVHNNLVGDARNMGIDYTDQDLVVDGDLVTARAGEHAPIFARAIIDMLACR